MRWLLDDREKLIALMQQLARVGNDMADLLRDDDALAEQWDAAVDALPSEARP